MKRNKFGMGAGADLKVGLSDKPSCWATDYAVKDISPAVVAKALQDACTGARDGEALRIRARARAAQQDGASQSEDDMYSEDLEDAFDEDEEDNLEGDPSCSDSGEEPAGLLPCADVNDGIVGGGALIPGWVGPDEPQDDELDLGMDDDMLLLPQGRDVGGEQGPVQDNGVPSVQEHAPPPGRTLTHPKPIPGTAGISVPLAFFTLRHRALARAHAPHT